MWKKALLWCCGAILLLAAAGYTAFQVSPWPSALIVRAAMDNGGEAMARALEAHVPAGIAAQLNLQYDAADGDAFLDVFYPSAGAESGQALPTVVWIHGGGWLSGDKGQVANYLRILAAEGFTTVGINYSLAPAVRYPTPIIQANKALAYLQQHAAGLNIDPSRLFLAGDSAGAQIAGQLANVISAPAYAQEMGMTPAIERAQLRGVILHCGPYDPEALKAAGESSSFLRAVSWSYFGTKDLKSFGGLSQFSVVRNLTAAFPPMYISVGNADPLAPQSQALAEAAAKLGVPVASLFFPADYSPPLPHEYQFNLDTEAGRQALARAVDFLKAQSQ